MTSMSIPHRSSGVENWPAIRQAAVQLVDDLHNLYPRHGEDHFAELQERVDRLLRQPAPATADELRLQVTALGELTLAAYQLRERIELGTVN
jgi:hypothetical protein